MPLQLSNLGPVPDGCVCLQDAGERIIRFSKLGNGWLTLFVSVWILVWTFSCVGIWVLYSVGWKMESGAPISIFMPIGFLAGWIIGFVIFSKTVLKNTLIRIGNSKITITSKILFFQWHYTLCKSSISRFFAIKDGGEGDDCFHTWAVKARIDNAPGTGRFQRLAHATFGGKKITIVSRSSYEQGMWLSKLLEQWRVDVTV